MLLTKSSEHSLYSGFLYGLITKSVWRCPLISGFTQLNYSLSQWRSMRQLGQPFRRRSGLHFFWRTSSSKFSFVSFEVPSLVWSMTSSRIKDLRSSLCKAEKQLVNFYLTQKCLIIMGNVKHLSILQNLIVRRKHTKTKMMKMQKMNTDPGVNSLQN